MQITQQRQMLHTIIHQWDKRFRLQQTVTWLPRAIMVGLLIGVIVALISRTRPWLTNEQVALMAVAMVVLAILQMALIIWLRPRQQIQSAQKFDHQFGLKERVSTALELLEGKIHTVDELASYQLDDAYQQAQAIDTKEKMPLTFNWKEWLVVVFMIAVLALLFFLNNSQLDTLAQRSSQQQAVAEAAEEVQDIIEDVALDPNLTEETREQLLESLQANLETLQEENISEEEALATMNDVESLLRNEADDINEDLQAQQEALEETNNSLQPNRPEPVAPPATASEEAEEANENLTEMSESLDGLSQEEMNALADALEAAADAMEQTNPEMAQEMRDAAEALRNGDPEAAQQALEQAAQEAREQAQDAQAMEQAAEQLEQSAEQAEQGQEQLEDAQSGQDGVQEQLNESGGMPQAGDQGQEGQSTQGEDATTMSGESEDSNPETMSNEPGQDNSQAGNMEARPGEDTTGAQEQQQAATGPEDDGSEGTYEEVFAPRDIQPDAGDEQVILDPSESDVPIQEGDFTENEVGESTVPYNEVFNNYANSANEALDSDYIPLGMRNVIRDYFTSLSPK